MNMNNHFFQKRRRLNAVKQTLAVVVGVVIAIQAQAQTANGTSGITQANQLVVSYFDVGCTLMYSIGAIVGLVGAVKVYNAWSHGDQQTNKLAASWFGACIFLVVVAAVLKSFFGVQ